MKKGRILCAILALCVWMTVGVQATEASDYSSYTIQTYNDMVITFEAAKKVVGTVTYDDTAYQFVDPHVDVYLLKPGSAVTVKTTDGAEAEYVTMLHQLDSEGVYRASSVVHNHLRSGSSDVWFEHADMAKIRTEYITEPREVNFYGGSNGTYTVIWDAVISETSVYVMVDDGRFTPEPPAIPGITDISEKAYYADAVKWALEKGIANGTSATSFSPNNACTTAQVLTFLWRANGSPTPASSDAVPAGTWYADAANWALEQGLMDTFTADAPATRAAMVTYLWRLAGSPKAAPATFSDVPAGADYAQAVAWAVAQGVTSGTGDNAFSPDGVCTRAQIVTFLYRAIAA